MVKIVLIGLGVLALAVFCMVVIVLVDDCLYWANKREGDDDRDNPR